MLLSLHACECCFLCMPANVAFSACLRMLLSSDASEWFLWMPANLAFHQCLQMLLSIDICECFSCGCLRMLLLCMLCIFLSQNACKCFCPCVPSLCVSEYCFLWELLLFFCRPVLCKNCFLWILQMFSVRVLNDAFSECLRVAFCFVFCLFVFVVVFLSVCLWNDALSGCLPAQIFYDDSCWQEETLEFSLTYYI